MFHHDQDQWQINALITISHQVSVNHQLLVELLKNQKVELPPELVAKGQELAEKTKALQAALDAQAS